VTPRKPRAPSGLGEAGRALWRRLTSDYEFDARELLVVEQAARQVDALALLERLLEDQGPVVVGSTGQPRLSPVLAEARQGRLAVGRLLDLLALPELPDEANAAEPVDVRRRTLNGTARRARHAANVRWARLDREEVRRGAGA
jgi:hypothetical protein